MILDFMIPLPPITKKNSQQILINKKTGKPFIMPSKKYKEYERAAMTYMPKTAKPIDYPVNIRAYFFMPTKRKCDLTNLLEALDDIMVRAGVIADDHYGIVAGHDGSRVFTGTRGEPRTFVVIEEIDL